MAVIPPYVEYMKISRIDESGQDLTPTLEALTQIKLPFPNGISRTYFPISRARYSDYFLFSLSSINNEPPFTGYAATLDYNFTGSLKTGVALGPASTIVFFPTAQQYNSNNIPISSSSKDNANFYDPFDKKYLLNTLPGKILNIRAKVIFTPTSTVFTTNWFGIYIIPPGVTDLLPNPVATVFNGIDGANPYLYKLSTNVGQGAPNPSTLEFDVDVPVGKIPPGSSIEVRVIGGAINAAVTILPGSEIYIKSTPAITGSTLETIPEPYLPVKFEGSDCDVLLNNVDQYPPNRFLQDIDYSGNPNTPVNFNALLSGSAAKGTVPESYYTSKNQIDPRYNGVKNQSSDVNLYNPKAGNTDFGVPTNIGTFGQTPSITSLDNTIVEFQWAGGTTPEIPLGGSFKLLNRILEVTSTNLVRTITPGDNPYEFGYIRKINSASGSPNFFLAISESRGDYYQALNNSYKRGTKLVPFIYVPNPGSNPTLPSITTIIETTIQVPSVSKFAGSSSYTTEGGFKSYGRWSSGTSYITIFGGNNNTPGFSGLERFITKLSYNDDEGRYGTRNSISVSGSGQAEVMDPILRSLESGERWFITLINNFDYPISINDKSQIFSEIIGSGNPGNNQQELNKKGVFEITGMSRSDSNFGSLAGALNFYTNVSNFTGTDFNLGENINGTSGLGFLIWKSDDSNQSQAVIVEDVTTGGVGTGAFIPEFTTDIIKENFEEITRKYGSNTSG